MGHDPRWTAWPHRRAGHDARLLGAAMRTDRHEAVHLTTGHALSTRRGPESGTARRGQCGPGVALIAAEAAVLVVAARSPRRGGRELDDAKERRRPRPRLPGGASLFRVTFRRPPVTGSIAENRATPDGPAHTGPRATRRRVARRLRRVRRLVRWAVGPVEHVGTSRDTCRALTPQICVAQHFSLGSVAALKRWHARVLGHEPGAARR